MAKSFKGGQGMNPLYIVLGIVIFILIAYVIYLRMYSGINNLSGQVNLNVTKAPDPILAEKLTNPSSTRYSYGIWIYVNSWDNTKTKTIFSRYNDIVLYLDKQSTILSCLISPTKTGSDTTDALIPDATAASAVTGTTLTITNNFPIQKWVFVTIVIDNQIVDMYIDGKLVKSATIPQVAPNAKTNIYYGFNYDTVISNFQRWTYPLDPQSVYNYYVNGASSIGGGSATGGYHATVTITKNNNPTSTYKLF